MPAPFTDQLFRGIADYGIKFPTLGDLGSGNPPATWLAEYQRVSRTAFASVLIQANASDGISGSGSRQFAQEVLIDALHCRRYDLDNTYVLPVHLLAYPGEVARRTNARNGPLILRFDNAA